jgi:hypothetical protein
VPVTPALMLLDRDERALADLTLHDLGARCLALRRSARGTVVRRDL